MPGQGRQASPWWTHFQVVNDDFRLVQCLHCNKLVRRGKAGCSPRETSNSGMATHIRSRHPEQANQVQRVIDAAREGAGEPIDKKDETVRGSLPLFKLRSKADREKWQKLIYKKGRATIKEFIDKEKPEFVSLALDGWSQHHHGYMGAIANYINSDWKRQALVLGCAPFSERHNSSNIADWMVKELDDWQLSHVTEMIISDTASKQMGIFNRELVPDLPLHLKPGKCACHLLQLCIGDCILLKPS